MPKNPEKKEWSQLSNQEKTQRVKEEKEERARQERNEIAEWFESLIKENGEYFEALQIKQDGSLDHKKRMDGRSPYIVNVGDLKSPEDLYQLIYKISQEHPNLNVSFETDTNGKWIKYRVTEKIKRDLDKKSEQGEEKIKEFGWEEKFKKRHEMLKEVAAGKKMKKEDVDQKEVKLTKEREELAKIYKPETEKAPEDKGKEVERLIKETEDELAKKIEQEKKLVGKELSGTEIYHLTRDFYCKKLGYKIEHKGLFGGKVRIKDKEGKYFFDEKTGKPIEFKKVPRSEAETPLIKFLREKYKSNIKEGLEKKVPEENKEEYKKWKERFGPLAEAWEEQEEFDKEIEKESDKLMQEKKDELVKKLDQERGLSGRKLSDTEIYTLSRNFYLGGLGYEIKYRGLLGGKARIWNREKDGYVIDEKTGKPVEFKTAFSPKGETSFLKFLEEEYKNKIIKKDLKAKYQEKTKETLVTKEAPGEGGETPLVQKEEAELKEKPLNASEFFARYLRANDLTEKDMTQGKLEELQEKWKAYQKEMGIKPPEKKERRKQKIAEPVKQEEKTDLKKEDLDQTPEKLKEVTQKWELYLKEMGVETERGKKRKPSAVITEKDSIYRYLSDGRTQRFKTATGELCEIQDTITFIPPYDIIKEGALKLFPHAFKDIKNDSEYNRNLLLPYVFDDYRSIHVIDENGKELNNPTDLEKAGKVFLHFIAKPFPERNFILPVSVEPKIGYSTYDSRYYRDEHGKIQHEKHIGHKVKEIKYAEAAKETNEIEEGKTETAKVVTQEGETESKPQVKDKNIKLKKKVEAGWKGVDFKKMETDGVFKKIKEMDIEKNTKDIIEIIQKYGFKISLSADTESLLRKYDWLKPEQYKFQKVKGNPESLKKWIAIFLTDIRYPEILKKIREIKLGDEEKEKTKKGVGEEPKGEKIKKNEQVFPVESILPKEELERRPKKNKGREAKKEGKKIEWLENARKLQENGELKLKMTSQLEKFFRDRGYNQEQIREMRKNPEAAWDKALEIYDKEQKEDREK